MHDRGGSMDFPVISIAEELRSLCPECRLGWLAFTAQPRESSPAVDACLSLLLPGLKTTLENTPLADMPNLGESRRGYKACGKDPGRWRVSSEALYRRIRQGKDLYRINTVVDVNNIVSLETGFSLGSYDRACLGHQLILRRGIAGESYDGIGKGAVDLENLPLLAAEYGPVGSPTSDSPRAMITMESRDILTLIYSFSPRPALEQALTHAASRFSELAGASDLHTGIFS